MPINSSQNILTLIADGLIIGFSRGSLNSKLNRMNELLFSDSYAIQTIKRLEKRNLISLKKLPNGITEIKITADGKEKILKYNFYAMELIKPKKWDGLWRVIIFDIPEKHKKGRDALRRKIQNLGMIGIQDSVFVYPYECFDEIRFVAEAFDVLKFVTFITAKSISDEEIIKNKFSV